ncbi:TPA: DUF1828 domain-containing protein [Pasteurella multocida]
MICNILLSNLGYKCHALASDFTQITTPFTLNDGSIITLFIEQYGSDQYLITDDAQTLMNISARGINLNDRRIEKIHKLAQRNNITLNNRGELSVYSKESDLAKNLNLITQNAIVASQLSMEWFAPPLVDNFEKSVKDEFKKFNFPKQLGISFDNKIIGTSGHEISVPITLDDNKYRKLFFTTSIKNSRSWAGAYGILGKMMDLSEDKRNKHYIIIDNDFNSSEFNELSLLFNDQATVLPFAKKGIWLERLAA